MKKIISSVSFILLVTIFQSCSPTPMVYHSEAELPYFHNSTFTTFKLINDNNKYSPFKFGVVSAKDNDTLNYVLLAPSKEGMTVNKLTSVNLTHSVPLLSTQVSEFIKILKSTSDNWNNKYENPDGTNYEFMVSPENKIIKESENVVVWYSTFRFYFQNNLDGPLCTIIFGEKLLTYVYTLDKLSEVQDLILLLDLAIKNK